MSWTRRPKVYKCEYKIILHNIILQIYNKIKANIIRFKAKTAKLKSRLMHLWNKVADNFATTCKAVGNMSEDIIDLLGPDKMYEPNLCQSPDDISDDLMTR